MNGAETRETAGSLAAAGIPATQPMGRRYRLKRNARDFAAAARPSTIPQYYAWLFAASVIGLILFFCVANPYRKDAETLTLAALVFGLASLPMVWFLTRGRTYQVPAFEAHALFLAFCFGFAGFVPIPDSANRALAIDSDDLIIALRCALLGVVMLLLGYYVIGDKLFGRVRQFSGQQTIRRQNLEWLAWCACLGSIAVEVLARRLHLSGVTHVAGIFFDLGFFTLLVLAYQKDLTILSLVLVWCMLLPYYIFYHSGLNSGQLAGVVTLLCWVGLVILRTKGHVPVPLFLGAFVFFLALQPVKFHVRELAWDEGLHLGPLETIQAYRDGFYDYYGSAKVFWKESGNTFETSFNRINHLSTLAAIIRDTPTKEPFEYGASYYPLLVKFIPRAIWPNKPSDRLGNDWARRYGYINENDFATAFNLAWLPEMFMNFGWGGVAVIMMLVGIFFRFLWRWLMENSRDITRYIVAITVAQSLVFTESNMSLMLGGVIILIIFLWLLGKVLSALGLYEVRVPVVTSNRTTSQKPPAPGTGI